MLKQVALVLLASHALVWSADSIRSVCCDCPLGAPVLAYETANASDGTQPIISSEPPLSVEYVLSEIGRSPGAVAAACEVAAAISRRFGHPIEAEEFAKKIQEPREISLLFSVRIRDLVHGFSTAQALADAGGAVASTNSFKLPKTVAWKEAPTYFEAVAGAPEQMFGNLYRYVKPSGISARAVRVRSAFGEILDRLALNRSLPERERFGIVYQDNKYLDFDEFIDALVRTGHKVEMDVSNEVADFLHLMFREPSGVFREVRTEVQIRTGYFTSAGDEITIPAVHSHLIFRVAGPQLNVDVEFYQGTHGTHFCPSLVIQGQSWVGIRKSGTYDGHEAVKALRAAGLYLDLLHTISREDALFAGGYGQSGICNDSVAVIEMLLNKDVTVYPLLIDKRRVIRQLDILIAKHPAIARRYRKIRQAVVNMPSDVELNKTQPQRILGSIPYRAGSTPYVGFNDARRTFARQK